MAPLPAPAPFAYVESDIPEGLTLVDWRRRHRATEPRGPRLTGRLGRITGLAR